MLDERKHRQAPCSAFLADIEHSQSLKTSVWASQSENMTALWFFFFIYTVYLVEEVQLQL